MKLVIVAALALVACAVAAPVEDAKEPVKILKSEFDQQLDGQYNFNFESEDGISKQETGEVKTVTNEKNEPVNIISVRGSYSYTDPDGVKHTVNYFSDETGFHSDNEPKA